MENQPLPGKIETPTNLSIITTQKELENLQKAKDRVSKLEEELSLAKIALENAEKSALTDMLTGLSNRKDLFNKFDKIIAEFNRDSPKNKREYALMMLDIDHFKNINDTYGHDTGDVVLKKAAEILLATFRETDTVARYGGEEFCVLIDNANIEELKKRLGEGRENGNQGLSFSIEINNKPLLVNFSGGIVPLIPEDINDVLQAITRADTLLYVAKSKGRNQIITTENKAA